MNSFDLSRIPVGQDKKSKKNIFNRIWKRMTHLWGWKVASLVLAICLWGGLISQDASLPREKTFTDVKINVTNATVMKNNGFIVVEGLEDLEPIQIKVSVPQKYYNSITPTNYNVRVDLSQIKEEGTQMLKIIGNSSSTVYGTITDMSVTEIPVKVERYEARTRIPVEVRTVGETPEGYMAVIGEYDPTRVDIAGPASVVNEVSSCVVEYDFSNLPVGATSKKASCTFFFETADGKRVDSKDLVVTSQANALQNINLALDLYPKMDVPIDTTNLISGEPAPGYEVTSVTVLPSMVTIAGEDISRYLNGEHIHPYSNINISGKKQDVVSTLTLRVPSSMEYISDTMITVIISIDPMLNGFLPSDNIP